MQGFYKLLVLMGLMLAAIIFYVIGGALGLITMVIVGVGFELSFWMRLLKQRPKQVEKQV